jgi:hypothetical protein
VDQTITAAPAVQDDGRRPPGNLSRAWRLWIVESLVSGVPGQNVVRIVREQTGASEQIVRGVVQRINANPAFEVAGELLQRLRKLESLLDVQQATRELSPSAGFVPRRRELGGAEFLEEFYTANRPVLIEDFATSWPALRRWCPQYLGDRFGAQQVQVMSGRDADDRYEVNWESHQTTMTLREYVDVITGAGESNDRYLVANNRLLELPGMRALLEDVEVNPEYLDPGTVDQTFLWFGPVGTVTPLHHDADNVLFVQVYGRKQISLISPFYSHRVYNDVSVYSEVDLERPDLTRHARFAGVQKLEVIVHPGEALFIPVGWWHHVRALDVSISVSFTSFRFPNHFAWQFPNIGGHTRDVDHPGG